MPLPETFLPDNRVEPFDRIAYPFSLDEHRHCTLWLPRKGLTRSEADRLKAYIDALVTEPAQEA